MASLVFISLAAYLVAMLFSMIALFGQTRAAERRAIIISASAALAQAYSAVFAAILLILFPLLERVSW